MLDLILLALLSTVLTAKLPTLTFIIAFAGGALIALLFGGSTSILKFFPALILSTAPPVIWASLNNPLLILKAGIIGIAVFAGYAAGSFANLLLFPLKLAYRALKKIF